MSVSDPAYRGGRERHCMTLGGSCADERGLVHDNRLKEK